MIGTPLGYDPDRELCSDFLNSTDGERTGIDKNYPDNPQSHDDNQMNFLE